MDTIKNLNLVLFWNLNCLKFDNIFYNQILTIEVNVIYLITLDRLCVCVCVCVCVRAHACQYTSPQLQKSYKHINPRKTKILFLHKSPDFIWTTLMDIFHNDTHLLFNIIMYVHRCTSYIVKDTHTHTQISTDLWQITLKELNIKFANLTSLISLLSVSKANIMWKAQNQFEWITILVRMASTQKLITL